MDDPDLNGNCVYFLPWSTLANNCLHNLLYAIPQAMLPKPNFPAEVCADLHAEMCALFLLA